MTSIPTGTKLCFSGVESRRFTEIMELTIPVTDYDKSRRVIPERLAFISNIKEKPCSSCGVAWPSKFMHLHHARGKKLFNIGDGRTACIERLRIEVEKCDLLCAFCHHQVHSDKPLACKVYYK